MRLLAVLVSSVATTLGTQAQERGLHGQQSLVQIKVGGSQQLTGWAADISEDDVPPTALTDITHLLTRSGLKTHELEVLREAENLDSRVFEGFNSELEQNRHWNTSCWLCQALPDVASMPKELDVVESRRQLLVDDMAIAHRRGLEKFSPPALARARLVLQPAEEWEDGQYFGLPGSADHNGTHFILYYVAARRDGSGSHPTLARATSSDGEVWSRQRLETSGLPLWDTADFCVLHDRHEANPELLFKAVFNCGTEDHRLYQNARWASLLRSGSMDNPVCLGTSADGVSWVFRSPLAAGVGDTLPCLRHEAPEADFELILRQSYQTPRSNRDVRGTKVLAISQDSFHREFINADLQQEVKATPWRVVNEWYFDAEFGKLERYRRQAYAHTRSKDPSGLFWGLTHLIEFETRPSGTDLHQYNGKMRALYAGASVGKPDRVRAYLSTSQDGAHFDFSSVYQGSPLRVRPPTGSMMVQPVADILTPGNGYHHIFFSATPRNHMERWDQSLRKLPNEKIYEARFREGRLMGLRPEAQGAAGELITKPFRWPAGAHVLGIDAHIAQGGTVEVGALIQQEHGQFAACWSVLLRSDQQMQQKVGRESAQPLHDLRKNPSVEVTSNSCNVERTIQLEFRLNGSVQLYGFQIGRDDEELSRQFPFILRLSRDA
mmetsp:Transcript_44422/g.81078  ORF Transcript_44422/g.81078 Transcript_44422/m.81078 type:complete len:664 (+) Transcript_44422:131-2122(+)